MLNHNYIGTEHILLGLIHEGEGVAAQALESLGVAEEEARQQVEEVVGRGQQDPPRGDIPFMPRAKKTLELSLRAYSDESDRSVRGFRTPAVGGRVAADAGGVILPLGHLLLGILVRSVPLRNRLV